MRFAPGTGARHMLGATEVVAVLGLVQPSELARRLACRSARRFIAIPLMPGVARVRTERLMTVHALAPLGEVHRRHPLRTDVRPLGRVQQNGPEQDAPKANKTQPLDERAANKTAEQSGQQDGEEDEFQAVGFRRVSERR